MEGKWRILMIHMRGWLGEVETQLEQTRQNETGEAKLNKIHTGQKTITIKQETDWDQPQETRETHTETQTD